MPRHSFQVEIPDDQLEFEVEAGQTLAEAAAAQGVEILTGCSDGQCGTCVVKVLEGEVDHRDRVLTPEKRAEGWMCACVSRARGSRLVIEVW